MDINYSIGRGTSHFSRKSSETGYTGSLDFIRWCLRIRTFRLSRRGIGWRGRREERRQGGKLEGELTTCQQQQQKERKKEQRMPVRRLLWRIIADCVRRFALIPEDEEAIVHKTLMGGGGGIFQAAIGFHDSDLFEKAIKMTLQEMHFEYDISPFRTQPHPCILTEYNISPFRPIPIHEHGRTGVGGWG